MYKSIKHINTRGAGDFKKYYQESEYVVSGTPEVLYLNIPLSHPGGRMEETTDPTEP